MHVIRFIFICFTVFISGCLVDTDGYTFVPDDTQTEEGTTSDDAVVTGTDTNTGSSSNPDTGGTANSDSNSSSVMDSETGSNNSVDSSSEFSSDSVSDVDTVSVIDTDSDTYSEAAECNPHAMKIWNVQNTFVGRAIVNMK